MSKKALLVSISIFVIMTLLLGKGVLAQDLGTVDPPPGLSGFFGGGVTGIPVLLSIILRTLIVIAGIYSVFNFILAGYAYISAGGDPKRVQDATSKITQTVIGLVVAAGSFVIAGVIGEILFNNPAALLQFTIFVPN
jgi:hypothetical protein